MKDTTEKIYNLITSERFENIIEEIDSIVTAKKWENTVSNELTYEELLNILPENIQIIKTAIENKYFDTLHYSVRNTILKHLTNINSYISNMRTGNAQLGSIMNTAEAISQQIQLYRLDLNVDLVPLYNEKINQYREISNKLNSLVEKLEETEDKQTEYINLIDKINQSVENIKIKEETAEDNVQKCIAHNESMLAIKEDSISKHEHIKDYESDSKIMFNKIEEIEKESDNFFNKVNEYIKNIEKSNTQTENIIAKNKSQTEEIDKQLDRAAASSLFHTFEDRRKELEPNINKWLYVIVVAIFALTALSYTIVTDYQKVSTNNSNIQYQINEENNSTKDLKNTFPKQEVSWIWFILKITLTFPIIYLIAFATSRYAKERRLIEEYAFKSSISLALTPYSDLVLKLRAENDKEHREFIINAINGIFTAPTDKVFGSNENKSKDNSLDIKTLNGIVDAVNKLKPQ